MNGGVLEGEVKYLSLAPNESGNYPFHISIENGGNLITLVQTGMTGTATITIEEKKVCWATSPARSRSLITKWWNEFQKLPFLRVT